MLFNERLRELREDNDLTQKDLALVLNISRSAYSGYENSTREPSLVTILKIADYFDVSLDYLFGRTNTMTFFSKSNKK